MIVNPYKHQPMMLGANTIYKFSFPVNDSTDLLGVTIDKDLSLIVTSHRYRFKNIITRDVMLRLYKAFILPHLQNCSLIYYFLGTRNCDKSEQIYSLRGNNILTSHLPKTTNNGPECIRCQAAKMWNSLSYRMRTITSYKDFKAAIKKKKMNL
ncbi:unnamed protein product [Pocillopora meandrina]|uniref:Uncharacterized protein n=1 Tax=Pocillopora meandrina TaxID=46732 RepID=A0AAU9VQI0_9CNID|nr:unnamed protein product [Pocillopora meandrina]